MRRVCRRNSLLEGRLGRPCFWCRCCGVEDVAARVCILFEVWTLSEKRGGSRAVLRRVPWFCVLGVYEY